MARRRMEQIALIPDARTAPAAPERPARDWRAEEQGRADAGRTRFTFRPLAASLAQLDRLCRAWGMSRTQAIEAAISIAYLDARKTKRGAKNSLAVGTSRR